MKRALGVLLIGLGLAGSAYGIFALASATSTFAANADAEAKAICASNEKVVKRSRQLASSSSRGTVYFCENSTGQLREITSQFSQKYIATVIQFVVLLLVGIGFCIVGSWLILKDRRVQ